MNSENRFRGRLFGGFNRQDVVGYIEKSAQLTNEYRASKEALEDRCDELANQLEDEKAKNDELYDAVINTEENNTKLNVRLSDLMTELDTMRETIASRDNELTQLNKRLAEYEQTIDSFERAKDRIAILELNASRRAVNIEKAAEEKADDLSQQSLALIQALKAEYENICNDTESTSAHIRGEMDILGNKLFDLTQFLISKADSFTKLDNIINHGMEDLREKR